MRTGTAQVPPKPLIAAYTPVGALLWRSSTSEKFNLGK
jgi:hypothetical protein